MPLRFFGASLLAHLFILGLFFWVSPKSKPLKAKAEPRGFVELRSMVAGGGVPKHSVPPKRTSSRQKGAKSSSAKRSAHLHPVRRFSGLQKKFEPWSDFAPKTFEEEDGNAPLRFSEGDSGPDLLKKSAVVLPHMHKFWSRIKEKVFYHDAILFRNVQGDVKVTIQVDRYGKLTYLNEATMRADHSLLKGWVAKGIVDALSSPIFTAPMARAIEIEMTFQFKLFPSPPEQARFEFHENRLHFDVHGYMPKSLPKPKVDRNSLTGEGTGLLSLTLPLYPMARTRSQDPLEVDIFARLEMYQRACDVGKAEGGCFEAAKIFKNMNRPQLASGYHKKACRLGIEQACRELNVEEPDGSITPPSEVVR